MTTEISRTTPFTISSERPIRINESFGIVIPQIVSCKTVPGISLFHNCGGGNFSGGTADQFDPPRRARLNLISKNHFIEIFHIATSLENCQKIYPEIPVDM